MNFSEISIDFNKRMRSKSKMEILEEEMDLLNKRLDAFNVTIKAILEEIQQSKSALKREQGNTIIAPLPITIASEHYNLLENKEFFISKEQKQINHYLGDGIRF